MTILFILSIILVGLLPIISIGTGWYSAAAYWNPMNFLPYPFAAILIHRSMQSDKPKQYSNYLLCATALLFVLFSFLDWTVYLHKNFFAINRFALPAYCRPSLVFLAAFLLMAAIRFKAGVPVPVSFMSKHSLALYCLHPFFVPVGMLVSGNIFLLALPVIVLLSYGTAILLPYFIQKDLIQ